MIYTLILNECRPHFSTLCMLGVKKWQVWCVICVRSEIWTVFKLKGTIFQNEKSAPAATTDHMMIIQVMQVIMYPHQHVCPGGKLGRVTNTSDSLTCSAGTCVA